ncbi:7557_t:CDS:2, partial [Funneliformis caledonium]
EKQDAESPKGVYGGRTEDVDNSSVIFWHFYVRKYQKHLVNNLIFSLSDNIMISNLFLCTISSNIRGEIQAISTNKARNENANPFSRAKVRHKVDMKGTLIKTPSKFEVIYGEVSGGLANFGIPASCPKKQYVDKVKLMIMLRDSLNQFFKDNRHVKDKQRKELTVYGWLQIGIELKIYAMDWVGSGIYRFGKLDKCLLLVDKDDSTILEDAYCILKLLESKLLESEKIIKRIIQDNTKNKRRRIETENSPHLNKN